MKQLLDHLLKHPLTRGLDIDDPRTTTLRRQIIHEKSFLRQIYQEWYAMLLNSLPDEKGRVMELGSGGGFFNQYLPKAITSDFLLCPGLSLVADAQRLPFADDSLRGIVMTDVLHHIPEPRRFLTEAARCVRRGGAIAMIEPWVTCWSSLIYRRLHHEPFLPDVVEWEIPPNGPLSGANGAMPWIIFHRDRSRFETEFPQWHINTIQPFMPLRYLLSGGVARRSFTPGWTFKFWRAIEKPVAVRCAMFALIVLTRR